MKKILLACVIASILISNPLSFDLEDYYPLQRTSITGKVSPSSATGTALIIGRRDTISVPLALGEFSRQVSPGIYSVIIQLKAPFRNVSVGKLVVKRNHVLNVGELFPQEE